MANISKVAVPIAVKNKTKLDLSCNHVTTMDFMQLQPVFYRHQIKGESLSVNCNSVIRPAPIEVPCFGRLRQNLRAFFVPYRLVFPNWHEFYNDVIGSNFYNNSLVSSPPKLSNGELIKMFFTDTVIAPNLSTPVSSNGDFVLGTQDYKLTKKGRKHLKILESLGYKLIVSDGKVVEVTYNALALLAFFKIYIDWYANSQYMNTADVLLVERLLRYNDPSGYLSISCGDLFGMLELVSYVVYDNEDYYVNAWDNPVSPNSGQFTAFSFNDPTSNLGISVITDGFGTPEMYQANASQQTVGTQYTHAALQKLSDYQRRHALAGARSIDRILAQYGMVTDAVKQTRCIYVGCQSIDINIGSVMATANGSDGVATSTVGDYSGAGFGNGQKSWDFVPDEEGIFIVLASIIPIGDMVQGYDRNNLHMDKRDFWTPEFDGLGVQDIDKGEVYVSDNGSFAVNNGDYLNTFGFTGRYAEYKRPKSFVTGDIRLPKFYTGGEAWHLMRLFKDSTWNTVANMSHSYDFARGVDYQQYYRMFQYTNVEFNPFFCFFHFDVGVYAPCHPLFESYEFENDTKKVETSIGSKVN